MSSLTIEFSYEPFSREPEYVAVNERFIASLDLRSRSRVLDAACGTGTLTALILDTLCSNRSAAPRLVGVDLCYEALQLAREYVADRRVPIGTARFIQASADGLPIADRTFDAVVLGNAIQLIDDKERLFADISRVLQRSGLFAFNTSFYAGAYVASTERFYLRWIQEALSCLKRLDEESRASGGPGVSRRKGLVKPAFSHRWLSVREYTDLLDRHGLTVTKTEERTVWLTRRCFETIGSYAGLACVLLSGYPIEPACRALASAAQPALDAAGMDAVPRRWLEIVAVKREGTA